MVSIILIQSQTDGINQQLFIDSLPVKPGIPWPQASIL